MTNDVSVKSFMGRTYEKKIDKNMMYYDYMFPFDDVLAYVKNVCEIDISDIVGYVLSMPSPEITAHDIFQFSNFNDATLRLCELIREANDPGLKHLDIGKLLLDDGIARKDGAYTKYGENHVKTGESLGLVFELSKTYFLTCIGEIYPDLSEDTRRELLTRLLLRNKFISRLISATSNGNVQMRQFLYMLSDSTYERRRSNIRTVIKELTKTTEYDFSFLEERLIFK